MVVRLRRADAMSSLSLTPLIDVVFLLLVFFLVAARFADEERRMEILLPAAAQARPLVSQPEEIVLNINDQGVVFWGREEVTTEQLTERLRMAARANPLRQTVLIRADRRCRWEGVVTVMDSCHAAGIRDIHPTTAGSD